MSEREVGIDRHCPFEQRDASFGVTDHVWRRGTRRGERGDALQVVLVGFRAGRVVLRKSHPLGLAQAHTQLGDDTGGNLVLDGKDVGKNGIECLAPQSGAVAHSDQRHVDAEPIPRAVHRAVEDRIDLELASGVEGAGIVRRVPADGARRPHGEPFDLPDARDNHVGQTEADRGVIGSRCKRFQRQHPERANHRSVGRRAAAKARRQPGHADEYDDDRCGHGDSPPPPDGHASR
jgi:hypothetical protein